MKVLSGSNLSMIRGDSESLTVRRVDKDDQPVQFVSGDTVRFTVRRVALDDIAVIEKIITEFLDGLAAILIEPADTNNIYPGEYVYDIELTDAGGGVATIVGPSKFIVGEDVSRA